MSIENNIDDDDDDDDKLKIGMFEKGKKIEERKD